MQPMAFASARQSDHADPEAETLSEEQQDALMEAVDTATLEVHECVEEAEDEYLSEWQELDSPQVVEDVDKGAFRESTEEPLTNKFGEEWGDTYQRIQEAAE